jgi:hypothetical protein
LSLSAAVFGHASASTNATFNQDILPILEKHCQVCHRPGEIGPMPLVSYAETRPWAKAIRMAVLSRKMPPWFADPAVGHFMNDRRLGEQEINKIVSWVDAGTPEGDAKDGHAPIDWTEGWNIQPDEIFQMPDPLTIPATGILEYVYVVIPTGYTKDVWVTAAEVRPGARAAVHHVIAVVRPPGSEWMKDAKPFVPYIPPVEAASGQAQPFLQPHMHVRGKDMTVRLVYPTGKAETMLAVPHYDFNWQIVYYLDKPRPLPMGTRVEVTAHWDNSANNPRNPDPAATVHWGNQSTDEMLSVAMGVIVDID